MNDTSLKKDLDQLPVPAPSQSAMVKARHRAGIAFANRQALGSTPAPIPKGKHWVAYFAMACVGIVVLSLGAMRWHSPSEEGPSDCKLLSEIEKLFPGQLDGVVTVNNHVSIDLSTSISSDVIPSQPLTMTLKRGREIVRILGYSGRRICINLGGRNHCLEPLVTSEGKVIVEGDDFLWSNTHRVTVGGYKLEARALSL